LDHAIIDQVQLAPDLHRAIKESIDTDRRRGRFLLTGSANILTLPNIYEINLGARPPLWLHFPIEIRMATANT
jgi:predicted AAA+ superfamily ATPase